LNFKKLALQDGKIKNIASHCAKIEIIAKKIHFTGFGFHTLQTAIFEYFQSLVYFHQHKLNAHTIGMEF